LACFESGRITTFQRFNKSTKQKHNKCHNGVDRIVSVEDPRCPSQFQNMKQLELFEPQAKKARSDDDITDASGKLYD